MLVAESTEPSPSAPELHDQSAEAGASTNPLPATELTRSTEADSEAPKPPPDPITERLKDLESAMRQIRLLIPDAENEDRLVYEAQYAEETARLRAALALQTPITGTVLVLQQSQVRSATASVLVEGALGFPAPITQADQGIAATAALGPKTGGNWWDQHQLNTDQRGVA
jgi:hypothetical protein